MNVAGLSLPEMLDRLAHLHQRLHEATSYTGRDEQLAEATALEARVLREGDLGTLRAEWRTARDMASESTESDVVAREQGWATAVGLTYLQKADTDRIRAELQAIPAGDPWHSAVAIWCQRHQQIDKIVDTALRTLALADLPPVGEGLATDRAWLEPDGHDPGADLLSMLWAAKMIGGAWGMAQVLRRLQETDHATYANEKSHLAALIGPAEVLAVGLQLAGTGVAIDPVERPDSFVEVLWGEVASGQSATNLGVSARTGADMIVEAGLSLGKTGLALLDWASGHPVDDTVAALKNLPDQLERVIEAVPQTPDRVRKALQAVYAADDEHQVEALTRIGLSLVGAIAGEKLAADLVGVLRMADDVPTAHVVSAGDDLVPPGVAPDPIQGASGSVRGGDGVPEPIPAEPPVPGPGHGIAPDGPDATTTATPTADLPAGPTVTGPPSPDATPPVAPVEPQPDGPVDWVPPKKPPRTGDEARFRRWVDARLKAQPDHVLNKILRDPDTGALRSNSAFADAAEHPGYDAAHVTTRPYDQVPGEAERFAIGDPWFNRRIEGRDEKLGVSFTREVVDIHGFPMIKRDAQMLENTGELPPGTVASAPTTAGWSSAEGYAAGTRGAPDNFVETEPPLNASDDPMVNAPKVLRDGPAAGLVPTAYTPTGDPLQPTAAPATDGATPAGAVSAPEQGAAAAGPPDGVTGVADPDAAAGATDTGPDGGTAEPRVDDGLAVAGLADDVVLASLADDDAPTADAGDDTADAGGGGAQRTGGGDPGGLGDPGGAHGQVAQGGFVIQPDVPADPLTPGPAEDPPSDPDGALAAKPPDDPQNEFKNTPLHSDAGVNAGGMIRIADHVEPDVQARIADDVEGAPSGGDDGQARIADDVEPEIQARIADDVGSGGADVQVELDEEARRPQVEAEGPQ